MSTYRLYYDDSYVQNFDAKVLSCDKAAPVQTPAGTVPAWEVVLDRTAFYPTSGGQPHDIGVLGDANVLDVRDEGDDIVHVVDRGVSGQETKGCVQWPRRFDHMQQHTGQHLLSAIFQERFGMPTVSFHLGEDHCTIDIQGREPSAEILQGAQRACNRVVFEDRPVTVRYGLAEELDRLGVRKKVDREGILRAIEIESVDIQPCGGTHVRRTGEIGTVLVRRVTKIRQDWRVEFVCGARAERAAMEDYRLTRQISERLGCPPEDAPAGIEKILGERDAHFKSLRWALNELAVGWALSMFSAAEKTAAGASIVSKVFREEHPELLLPLATEIAKKEGAVALLAHAENGQVVFAQNPKTGDFEACFRGISREGRRLQGFCPREAQRRRQSGGRDRPGQDTVLVRN
jgi:alanyl-tRNA synthetase